MELVFGFLLLFLYDYFTYINSLPGVNFDRYEKYSLLLRDCVYDIFISQIVRVGLLERNLVSECELEYEVSCTLVIELQSVCKSDVVA